MVKKYIDMFLYLLSVSLLEGYLTPKLGRKSLFLLNMMQQNCASWYFGIEQA